MMPPRATPPNTLSRFPLCEERCSAERLEQKRLILYGNEPAVTQVMPIHIVQAMSTKVKGIFRRRGLGKPVLDENLIRGC